MPCTKKQFTKVEARSALNVLLNNGNLKDKFGRIYPCGSCNFWHLTHQQEREETEAFVVSMSDKWATLIN